MSIHSLASRVPRTTTITLRHSIQMPMTAVARLGGTRSVGGTSMPKPDTPPNKGTNVPIAIAAVAAVAGATYFVTRSSKQHGENIVHDAEKKKPKTPQQVQKVGEPTSQPGGLGGEITQQEMNSAIRQGLKTDAPKTAYESEEKGKSSTTGRSG